MVISKENDEAVPLQVVKFRETVMGQLRACRVKERFYDIDFCYFCLDYQLLFVQFFDSGIVILIVSPSPALVRALSIERRARSRRLRARSD